jgi:hypothetical protein
MVLFSPQASADNQTHGSTQESHMAQPNYESQWWGYIYDQMMVNLQHVVDSHQQFYRSTLAGVQGVVLECACGTSLFLLPLLAARCDRPVTILDESYCRW